VEGKHILVHSTKYEGNHPFLALDPNYSTLESGMTSFSSSQKGKEKPEPGQKTQIFMKVRLLHNLQLFYEFLPDFGEE
jgi:hypothetical protein